MAIINTKLGGTDKSDGEVLSALGVNDTWGATLRFIGSDFTVGSITASTTETEIGEVIVPANTVVNELIILVGVRWKDARGVSEQLTGTFRIRTGTSSTATSNTERASLVLSYNSGSGGAPIYGGFLVFRITSSDETFSGEVQIHVTGRNNDTSNAIEAFCESILVLGR